MRAAALATAVAVLAIAAFGPTPARADGLLLTLSSQEIVIASNYQGGEVTVFGAALDRDGDLEPVGDYDLVITTRGPAETLAVREKARTFGLWINRAGRDFARVPSFLSVLANRQLDEIADFPTRLRDELGLDAAADGRDPAASVPLGGEDATFAAALRRLQERRGLWRENGDGVAFVGASLFKGTIRLPPNVPFGAFEVEARLMRGGATLARETIAFRVVKSGFEARMAEFADTSRAAYGLATVALALLFGWLASVIFRRD